MNKYKLIIEYDGSKYKGWQRLHHTDKTIQAKIEALLSKILDEKVEIHGSGRTDAGVHAFAQVAHFETREVIEEKSFIDICNNMLPQDIVFKHIEKVSADFHGRYSAKSKKYVYKIWNSHIPSALYRKYYYNVPEKLDVVNMNKAIQILIGEHDFSAFTANKSKKKSNIRTIISIDIKQEDDKLELIFYGNGFLYKMVRLITGTLIEVGLGKKTPEEVKNILASKDRKKAGQTAPAHGLYLIEVDY